MNADHDLDRFRGALLGLACGDALGTTVEFSPRGSFPPVIDMIGGGPFRLKPGEWTDDTSMALCLAASLVECGQFDSRDQMERYCRWRDEGYMSSNGRCFDIGNTVARALRRFNQTGEPYSGSTDPNSAGNGCIMRLAPVPMFCLPRFSPNGTDLDEMCARSSRTTHGAQECVDACRLFGTMLSRALRGMDKERILSGYENLKLPSPSLARISRGEYRAKTEAEIQGTGYVVDSLEAALWCFSQTDSFEEAVLRAVNLGDDADTTGAVCGQLAGAYYGLAGIPDRWVKKLAHREMIQKLADRLLDVRPAPSSATFSAET